ncbi:HAD-IIA family hydrolase [Roseobacter sp. S98]|uniref:HAD-IIA family hydrolase n=1 Tax=Roseobacter algicola (ex Choi et al. 2025) (nom. illeg.) TaxID=3092138 RepID=UPI003F51899A
MEDAVSIFERYQSVRHRLPGAVFDTGTTRISSLMEISDAAEAFVFDAFGVLNVGETPIPGAAERLDQLRAAGRQIRILSNAASYNHDAATEKFRRLGVKIEPHEIITSRDAALQALDQRLWGCIAAPGDDLSDIPAETLKLADDPAGFDDAEGFLFLSAAAWTSKQQSILTATLQNRARPVIIANADVAAPRDHGFSLEPGHFGHLLSDNGLESIRFFGKPFPEVFQMVERALPGIASDRIVMCGDTLHTDILGAAARGWRTVLVERDGMFSGVDAGAYAEKSSLVPTWRLQRI